MGVIDFSKYDEIIIWGASFPPSEIDENATSHGHSMEKLVDLLKQNNAWEKVVLIVDSNELLHGKRRMGIAIDAPKNILHHSGALIIINTISIQAIKRALEGMGAENDCAVIPYYFYHGTLDYPYRNDVAKKDMEMYANDIKSLYQLKDTMTSRYLDIIFDMRSRGGDMLYELSYYEGTGEGIPYFCDPELAPIGDVTYIDVGAFDGDSLKPVEKFYGDRLKSYIGFEPDPQSIEKLKKYVSDCGLSQKAVLFPYALGACEKEIRFSVTGSTSQKSEYGDIVLEQKKFDDFIGLNLTGDIMVKMDIEGAELDALMGMKHLIRERNPYLAICIYHKERDLYEIADYIKKINPEYQLYIRGGWHLECWAIPQRHFG